MERLTVGVIARSRKENERRLPIHPLHLDRIEAATRSRIFLERGYGEHFGVPDERLAPHVAGVLPRERLIAECDVVLNPKPTAPDLAELRKGQILWGWPHSVQNPEIVQHAVDRRLTLIAFEAMHHRPAGGGPGTHVFHKNNELAGFCSVLHALSLTGVTGVYGRRLRAAVISFGATARGAITALNAHGVHDIDVLTRREVTAVAAPIHSARIVHFDRDPDRPDRARVFAGGDPEPMAAFLARHDIVVNCVLQDTGAPLMFATARDLPAFAPGTLVVDVSLDTGMGFDWAAPTTFTEPMFTVGDGVRYYGVDHSASYLWDSATREISRALLPHLGTVLAGPSAWDADPVIGPAVDVRDGVVQNPAILAFQDRSPHYPHPRGSAAPLTGAGAARP
ncbi:N(5)-(carboxyethyl)ornithine synthase [Actinomadura roseirufa]|uniref:N(5)-(carboxyethyl)ornithine synthase n=1 Tax=Actinomadura roseirufa TaxID=2094049 RepID=UPI0010417C64|nr:N(5)-(carboxyethyl)ornithine synthase [Actinomadura roseirufa]